MTPVWVKLEVEAMRMSKAQTTSWVVLGLGALVAAVGLAIPGRFGAGVIGFGLAHVVLGALDMFRPSVQD